MREVKEKRQQIQLLKWPENIFTRQITFPTKRAEKWAKKTTWIDINILCKIIVGIVYSAGYIRVDWNETNG